MTTASAPVLLCRWVDLAACAGRPDLPWVADADVVGEHDRDAMAAVCFDCPVLGACASSADALETPAGWWAGRHLDAAPVVWEQGALDWPATFALEDAA